MLEGVGRILLGAFRQLQADDAGFRGQYTPAYTADYIDGHVGPPPPSVGVDVVKDVFTKTERLNQALSDDWFKLILLKQQVGDVRPGALVADGNKTYQVERVLNDNPFTVEVACSERLPG